MDDFEIVGEGVERFREEAERKDLLSFLESVKEGLPCMMGLCKDPMLKDCCC